MAEARPFLVNPIMDVDLFVKANNCPQVTNPIFFSSRGVPTEDGLLSNELFGTTTKSRANIFGYIDLGETFLHPLAYKLWNRMDSTISKIVWSDDEWRVNSKGEIVPVKEGESGESGIEFLKKNIDKIKIKKTDSNKRNTNIEFLKKNKQKIFITKMIVSPPYIRDVLVSQGKTEVGELNKMYQKILINVNALKSLSDYGITTDALTRGKIQEGMLEVYNWLIKEPNLGQKKGVIRRAVLSKTTDYSSRLVMSAPELDVESPDKLLTNMDYATIPLPSLCANIKPFLLFWLRSRFHTIMSGTGVIAGEDGNRINVDDFEEQFSDERFEKEISRFIEGYSNRFAPIEYYDINGKIHGFNIDTGYGKRKMTWCDIFYMGAFDIVQHKHALITRYPVDSYYSQFPCRIRVISTIETQEFTFGTTTYPNYPLIKPEEVGSDTSNKFRDTANIFNPYLGAIGGDYDGDQINIKVIFSDEANEEAEKHLQSKMNYINLGVEPTRSSSNEAVQAMYNLTLILPDDKQKISRPQF